MQDCHDAVITFRLKFSESNTPKVGTIDFTTPADLSDTLYRQPYIALQSKTRSDISRENRQYDT